MSAEGFVVREREELARLIGAVATVQDRGAFCELFNHFAPRVKTYLLRSGASETSAEELAQEAMLAIWRRAHLFDSSMAAASTWIFRIARNLHIDAARRERRGLAKQVSPVGAEFEVDETPLPDAQLASVESQRLVRSALSRLSPGQMRVIELSFFEEKAHSEIARILEIPLGTAKSRLRLALDRLRDLLSGVA
jgi:RNA polymerase sigma-70 factor (ECF subfamily)